MSQQGKESSATTGVGTTPTERYLAGLCHRSFLNLWSWPNVYRDQGVSDTGQGKEVCDLLVVFGEHVIIFSDKYCQFGDSGDLERDWRRWFKRAIWKSAMQTWGAERWIREHPDRLFLDPACTEPFPIRIPDREEARFSRVVVAHGSGDRCREHLGGSGSLMIMPRIQGVRHFDSSQGEVLPFCVGRLSESKGFVHVIDDFSLDVLLQTLDTAPDFIRYLEKKESLVDSGRLSSAAGEEDLLAYYLRDVDESEQHDFIVPEDVDWVVVEQGLWEWFREHPDRLAQIEANRISYVWDRNIEWFTTHVLEGRTEIQSHESVSDLEVGIRLMARESRTHRRMLAVALLDIMTQGRSKWVAARVIQPDQHDGRYYVFMSMKPRHDRSYSEYRQVRQNYLAAYCKVLRLKNPKAMDIVGIASEPPNENDANSQDLIVIDGRVWNQELAAEAQHLADNLGILSSPTVHSITVPEYPKT